MTSTATFSFNSPFTPSPASTSAPYTPRTTHSSPYIPSMSSPSEALRSRRNGADGLSGRARPAYKPGPRRAVVTFASPENNEEKDIIRRKFKAKCFQRALVARSKAVQRKRMVAANGGGGSAPWDLSSDGFDLDDSAMDDDDEGLDDMDDELFRRIMVNESRKRERVLNASYEREVGSSFDPAFHDPSAMEEDMFQEGDEFEFDFDDEYDPDEDIQEYMNSYYDEVGEGFHLMPDADIPSSSPVKQLPLDRSDDDILPPSRYGAIPHDDGLTTPQRIRAFFDVPSSDL